MLPVECILAALCIGTANACRAVLRQPVCPLPPTHVGHLVLPSDDIYAFGILMWEVLNKSPWPFKDMAPALLPKEVVRLQKSGSPQ